MEEENIVLPGQPGFVYRGPTWSEMQENLKKNHPRIYNQIQQGIAERNGSTREILTYKDADGNIRTTTNTQAGVLSPADPVAEFYVAGKVLNPLFNIAGRVGEYGLARMGNNWARARILSRTINNTVNNTQYLNYPLNLRLLERRPSRITEAERLGIPKGERNQVFKAKALTSHVQGDEAVKMFKEYGGEPIPEGSINGEQLRKYVAEARERYGIRNNKNITDEEIAEALYKHSKELGANTAAVNAQGEPQLLFRGDTKRYSELREKISPEELAGRTGTMDNSLGNLFLGEFPSEFRGVDRYIGTWRYFRGNGTLFGSGTGSKVKFNGQTNSSIEGIPLIGPQYEGGYKLYSHPHRKTGDMLEVYKLPASMMDSEVNDLNAFVVRTPAVRDATSEISVLNDDWLVQGAQGSNPHMRTKLIYDKDGFPLYQHPDGTTTPALAGADNRPGMMEHYRYVLDDAKKKGEGLLRSNKNAPLRDEHDNYTYFALPNFNISGAKHLLPFDLRISRNWKDKNIYRVAVPLTVGTAVTTQKQGGKMNIIEFLKKGSGIHIKESQKGSFTKYCNGKVTNECIQRGKNSPNPKIRKKAVFVQNSRRWKHQFGGQIKKFQQPAGTLQLNDSLEELEWDKYRSMTPEQQYQWRTNKAKSYLRTPSIPNLYRAAQAYFGPTNPHLITGEPAILPSTSVGVATKVVPNATSAFEDVKFMNWYNRLIRGKVDVKNLFKPKYKWGGIRVPVQQISSSIKSGEVPYTTGKISVPLEGLTVREAPPLTLENYVSNPAEKAAMLDFKQLYEDVEVGRTSLPTGRPSTETYQDIMYPWAFEKWKAARQAPKAASKSTPTTVKANYKAPKLNPKDRYRENKGVSGNAKLKDKNAKSYEFQDARHSNSGQSRMRNRQNQFNWDTLKNYGGDWSKRANRIEIKLAKYPRGSYGYTKASQDKKQLIDEFINAYRFKTGGKVKKHQAFVNGVSVLDSNPEAYKQVKKKIKMAASGDNTQNWWQRNQGTISNIGGLIANGISGIVSGVQNQKAVNQQVKANEAKNKLTEQELYNKYFQEEYEKVNNETLPDGIHASSTYNSYLAHQRATQRAKAEYQKAANETAEKNAQLQATANNNMLNSVMGTVGNVMQTGVGLLANRKPKITTTQATTPKTTSSWMNQYFKPYNLKI